VLFLLLVPLLNVQIVPLKKITANLAKQVMVWQVTNNFVFHAKILKIVLHVIVMQVSVNNASEALQLQEETVSPVLQVNFQMG